MNKQKETPPIHIGFFKLISGDEVVCEIESPMDTVMEADRILLINPVRVVETISPGYNDEGEEVAEVSYYTTKFLRNTTLDRLEVSKSNILYSTDKVLPYLIDIYMDIRNNSNYFDEEPEEMEVEQEEQEDVPHVILPKRVLH